MLSGFPSRSNSGSFRGRLSIPSCNCLWRLTDPLSCHASRHFRSLSVLLGALLAGGSGLAILSSMNVQFPVVDPAGSHPAAPPDSNIAGEAI